MMFKKILAIAAVFMLIAAAQAASSCSATASLSQRGQAWTDGLGQNYSTIDITVRNTGNCPIIYIELKFSLSLGSQISQPWNLNSTNVTASTYALTGFGDSLLAGSSFTSAGFIIQYNATLNLVVLVNVRTCSACAPPTNAPTSPPNNSTSAPTNAPTSHPTNAPTSHPTNAPTSHPTNAPTSHPTNAPTSHPTNAPTSHPTNAPTSHPTNAPTSHPTHAPTSPPNNSTSAPTNAPTSHPTNAPTSHPTHAPNNSTSAPTNAPTSPPTNAPTSHPTNAPTSPPNNSTSAPTNAPTSHPTNAPTSHPTNAPTSPPNNSTSAPTNAPTSAPTNPPTPPPVSAALLLELLTAPTEVEREALLTGNQFVFDFTNASSGITKSSGGRTVAATRTNFPAIIGHGVAMTVGFIEPCGINLPHTHPRATEINFIVSGSFQAGFFQENGARFIGNILQPGMATVFPQGAIHFELNLGCEPAVFVAAFNNEDPGVQTIAQSFFGLPTDVTQVSLNISSIQTVEDLAAHLPANPAVAMQECMKTCGL